MAPYPSLPGFDKDSGMDASLRALPFALVLALSACGGAEPTTSTPAPGPTAAPSAAPAAPTGPFSSMTPDQKLEHMKTVIRPTMGKLFEAYDGKRYADFGCGTCHGEKKQDTHQALPKLTLSGDGFKKLTAEKPAVMKFMAEQVTPAMAKAMNEKPFDPATHQGFGCAGCHTVQ